MVKLIKLIRPRALPAKIGWKPIRAIDLRLTGDAPGICERCGRRDLRFLHTVEHPEQGQLHVGCECAKRLCHGYNPEREESRLRNLYARRSRWLTRNWGRARSGNDMLELGHKGETVRVTIFVDKRDGKRYRYSISANRDEPVYSPRNFPTADAAKLAAFDLLAEACEW